MTITDEPPARGRLLLGTCSWTDRSLIDAGTFYPRKSMTAEARLQFYAAHFPIVEIDSSYYALPSVDNAMRWVERTPDDFRFDIKAYGLFTGHPVQPLAFPQDLKEALPPLLREKRNVYGKDLDPAMVDEMWARYEEVLAVLRAGGKLGVVLFQFPPWFTATQGNRGVIEGIRHRLPDYQLAIEFRGGRWMEPERADRVLDWLRGLGIAYTCVDEPQGFRSSTPPVVAATAPVALVRYHGRNAATWELTKGAPSDRFDHYYTLEEMAEWVEPIHRLQEEAGEVHLLMNTNKGDQGIVNARSLAQVLGEHLPG